MIGSSCLVLCGLHLLPNGRWDYALGGACILFYFKCTFIFPVVRVPSLCSMLALCPRCCSVKP